MFDLLIHIETCIGQAMDMKNHDDDDRELGESIHEACTNMMTKWNKYFSTADHLNVVAHIMDPRFKLRFLADMFKEQESMIEDTFKPMIRNMYRLFNESNPVEVIPIVPQAPVPRRSTSKAYLDLPTTTPESELEGYLLADTELFHGDVTILTWWKSNAVTRYPRLSRFARSILAIPATSVPSECTFSTSGRVISDYRSSLNAETVQALMLYGDWLKKRPVYRLQI
jgi:hypothetical protein